MQEVFSFKGDGHPWHGDIIVMTRAVADICANAKCNWFGLPEGTKQKETQMLDLREALNDRE